MDNKIKSPLEITHSDLDWQGQQIAEMLVDASDDLEAQQIAEFSKKKQYHEIKMSYKKKKKKKKRR
jgi:hypothetical protein